MSARDPGGCFYDADVRVKYARWLGFTYGEDHTANNTDRGVVYYTAIASGGTVTVNVYAEPTMQSGSLVASGSASVSSTEWTVISITEENSSNLSGTLKIDFTDDSSSITAGKQIVTFSFDYDLELYEKVISDWSSSNAWEGEGTTGCAFVRAHRAATAWVIHKLMTRLKGQVDYDNKNLPDLFDMDLTLEEMRDGAVKYALHHIYLNQKNSGNIEDDPFAASAAIWLQEAEKHVDAFPIHLDLDADGDIDSVAKARTRTWV